RAPRLLPVRIASAAIAAGGVLLMAFPQMDQPWLDALERAAPSLQDVFLTPAEREMRQDSVEAIARANAELTLLRAREQDVRWGTTQMATEKQERLRQYLAARSEIQAGDQLVLKELRVQARARQRWGLGVPLLLIGTAALLLLRRRGAAPSVGG
ncbi:MAG: hypothetical protein M3150_04530, partial [Pseudomonadota bacterium]|nr:hypothetical protein [Pseudomonadota bacterium]